MSLAKKAHLFVLSTLIFYLVLSFFIINDYGITFDEPENFAAGLKYLNFYITGQLNFNDNFPEIKGHPDFYIGLFKNFPYRYGSAANILSAVSCYVFYQRLHLLDPISAHHIIIPILAAFFLYSLYLFVKKHWGIYQGLTAVLVLLTLPRFFGDSFNNIKDIPQVIFSSITIMLFAEWVIEKRIKFLYCAFIVLGIALAVKLDAVLVLPILALWFFVLRLIDFCFAKQTSLKENPFKNGVKEGQSRLFTNAKIKNGLENYKKSNFSFKYFSAGGGYIKCAEQVRQILSFYFEVTRLKTLAHIAIGLAIIAVIFVSLYPPLFSGQYNAGRFISDMVRYYSRVGVSGNVSWNMYAPVQIVYTTPAAILGLFFIGFVWLCVDNLVKKKENLLLIIWLLFPILRHCLPFSNHYDGIRHFLIFTVPFSIITSLGVYKSSEILSKYVNSAYIRGFLRWRGARIKQTVILCIICMFFLVFNIYSLILTHPYQTTYFNSLAGGLKGAQYRGIPFSCDYWLNSYRKAGEWLQKNAALGAKYYAFPYPELFKYYISREDLEAVQINQNMINDMPSNMYFIVVPRKWWPDMLYVDINDFISLVSKLKVVYQIKKQGGEIITVYYNP